MRQAWQDNRASRRLFPRPSAARPPQLLLVCGWQALLLLDECNVLQTRGCVRGWPLLPMDIWVVRYYNLELGWYMHLMLKHSLGEAHRGRLREATEAGLWFLDQQSGAARGTGASCGIWAQTRDEWRRLSSGVRAAAWGIDRVLFEQVLHTFLGLGRGPAPHRGLHCTTPSRLPTPHDTTRESRHTSRPTRVPHPTPLSTP
jgi:hypothetical protein